MTKTHIMLDLETWGTRPGFDLRSIGACVFDPISGKVGLDCPTCKGGTIYGNINMNGDCSDCMNTRTDNRGEFYIAVDNPTVPPSIIIDTPMNEDTEFVRSWRTMERDGFLYGTDALENVHLGWTLANNREFRKYPLRRDPETVQWWNDQSEEVRAAFANPIDLADGLRQFAEWIKPFPNVRIWAHGPQFDCSILDAAYHACGLPVPWHYRAPRDTRTILDLAGIDDHGGFMDMFSTPGAIMFMDMFSTPGAIMHHALDDAIVQARAVCAAWRIIETRKVGS